MSNETSNNGSKISIVVLVIALIGSWIYFVNTNNTKTEIITNYTAEVAVLDSTKIVFKRTSSQHLQKWTL